MFLFLHKALLYLHDLIFPKACLGCRREGQWLCSDCLEKIGLTATSVCPICKQPSKNCLVCSKCRGQSFLDGLWVIADYDDRLVQDLIKALKYDYINELAVELGRLVQKYFVSVAPDRAGTFLLPMPLHRRRLLERGFNQSELIAKSVGEFLGLPLAEPLLRRKKYLPAQAKLSRPARMANIKSAFVYDERFSQADRRMNLILVDDVYTTGATMQECAKVLKKSGFDKVWGLVIARGK